MDLQCFAPVFLRYPGSQDPSCIRSKNKHQNLEQTQWAGSAEFGSQLSWLKSSLTNHQCRTKRADLHVTLLSPWELTEADPEVGLKPDEPVHKPSGWEGKYVLYAADHERGGEGRTRGWPTRDTTQERPWEHNLQSALSPQKLADYKPGRVTHSCSSNPQGVESETLSWVRDQPWFHREYKASQVYRAIQERYKKQRKKKGKESWVK